MRERVEAAIEALGYRTNPAARLLVSGRSGTIGVLLRNAMSDYYSTLFAGLQTHATESGIRIVGATGSMIEGSEAHALKSLLELGVDAMVIGSGRLPTRVVYDAAQRVPTVVVARLGSDTGASAVLDDPGLHASITLGTLWNRGHRRVLLLDPPGTYSSTPRVSALRREANELGIRMRTENSTYDAGPSIEAARRWLAGPREETAIITLGYESATGVIWALREAGVRVPVDVSVVAADAYHLPVPLTVDLSGTNRDQDEFMKTVWEELLLRLDDPNSEARDIFVPVTWHEGQTLTNATS